MTDYIELVLGEQEDEREERDSLAWGLDRPEHIPTWGGTPLETRGMDVGRGASRSESFERTAPLERELLNGDVGRGLSPSVAARQLPRQREPALAGELLGPSDGGRAPTEREPRAEVLRARLRRAEVAAGYRGEMAATEAREEWSGDRGRSVLELDAAFSRDARRYDNGFELF